MTNHTLTSYDKQLNFLTDAIVEMGGLVKEMILLAKRSLVDRDPSLVDQAVAMDKRINALDFKIEQQATVVLALQNPMAVDLRFVTSALKIAVALERAGDLAKNTAKRSIKLGSYVPTKTIGHVTQMVDIVISMLDDALAAIKTRNPAKATDVWRRDDQVDDLYHVILTGMQEEMQADPKNILSCTHFVFAAKNFERIADYATNIAKTVHYITSGKPADKATIRGPKQAASDAEQPPATSA